ncbi:MAG: DUF2911 domain-containing protein [Bacteroidota bacterium]
MVSRLLCSLLFLIGVNATAQERTILSPRDSVLLTFGNDSISVNYGRPSMRGRVIMGKLVPWNEVWRTGANEATHLRTNFACLIGGVPLPKGTYTLWTLPSPTGWKIIINKQTGQWGTRYDERQDLARFDASVEHPTAVVDTFTVSLTATGKSSGRLVLSWENTRVWTPFKKNDQVRPLSPLDSSSISVGGTQAKIVYSTPFARGRHIWGVVVPYDSVWRTGANAATMLTIDGPLQLGNASLAAGSYVLRTVPGEQQLTLLVSKKPSAPGPIPDNLIVGRVTMKAGKPAQTIDPFKIWFTVVDNGTSMLKLGWADREYSVGVKR